MKRAGRSKSEKDKGKGKSQSVLASPAKIEDSTPKSRSLPIHLLGLRYRLLSSVSTHPKERKKNIFQEGKICQIHRQDLDPLFKVTSVDGNSVEDLRNFPKEPGVISWIMDTGRDLRITYTRQMTLSLKVEWPRWEAQS